MSYPSNKSRKLSHLKQWYEKLANSPLGYRLEGKLFDATTRGMSLKQVELMLSLTAAAYASASEESRQRWAPAYHAMREAAERATGCKDISYAGIRLVVSNNG